MLREGESKAYAHFVVERHTVHRACVLEDNALQVSNVIMVEGTPSIVLTESICNLEACFFALMQYACDEETLKSSLILTLLMIISR